MALTRAQLLSGNNLQGVVLPGQVQGVTAGTGVLISTTGSLSINTADPAFNAFIRTNSAGAYNSYIWPSSAGTAGQQLTKGIGDALVWSDSDGIPWTAKGQLVVGTGANTDILLNVGSETSVLMADPGTPSGLNYSDAVSSAIQIPAGSSGQQPLTPSVGQLRYNLTTNKFEGYIGSPPAWLPLGVELYPATSAEAASGTLTSVYSSPATAVPKDAAGMTGAAILPSGSTAQQPAAPVEGMARYNITTSALEFYAGTDWIGVTPKVKGPVGTYNQGASIVPVGTSAQRPSPTSIGMIRFNTDTANFELFGNPEWYGLTRMKAGVTGTYVNGAALIPAGTTAQQPPAASVLGAIRYNTSVPQMEYSDGVNWLEIGDGPDPASLAEAQAGVITTKYSSPETSVPKDASGMAGAAILPGSSASYAGAPATGMLRYNSATLPAILEYYNGSSWVALSTGAPPSLTAATLAEAAAGTLTTVFSSPETAVPKDASGMAGAAILPGSAAAYAGAPTTGMLRYNSSTLPAILEYYNGSSWVALSTGAPPALSAATLAEAAAGTLTTVFSSPQTAVPKDASGMAGAAILPGSGAAYSGSPVTGMIRYNNSTPPAVIEYYNGSSWVALFSGTPTPPPVAATSAQAAAGTLNTVFSSPETAVPKDAAGMTGAALIPTGNSGQRPSPTNGMLRFNTDQNSMEVYNSVSSAWRELAYVQDVNPLPASQTWSGGFTAGGTYSVNNLTITDGSVITPSGSGTFIYAYGNVTIGNNVTFQYGGVGVTGTGSYESTVDKIGGLPGLGGAPGTPDYSPSGTVPWVIYSPGSGGSGVKGNTTNGRQSQQGGNAGGVFVIYCLGNVTIGNGCTFNAWGGNVTTTNGTTYSGGGAGGGAGGTIVIQAQGNLAVGASSFLVYGGNGGNALATGGAASNAAGGGGGGGGYIIFGAGGTFSDSSGKNANGGAGGAGTGGGTPQNRGSGGGGNAGRGGAAGTGAGTGQTGQGGTYQYMLTF